MAPLSEPLHDLTSDDWAALDEVIERYETAWGRGERPALEQGLPAAGNLRRAALRELIHGELEIRLKAGEPARVEEYLGRFPEVNAGPEQLLSLLAREYELRRRQEPQLGLDEYQRRFPQFGPGFAAHVQSLAGRTSVLEPAAPPARLLSPAVDSAAALVTVLTAYRLLEPAQLGELGALASRTPDARALGRELVQRGWLTPWQVNQVFLRHASELRLGPYLLLDRVGEGGMGTVYRARHSVMRRLAALKVIRRDRLADTVSVRRFYREVRAVARLAHANIVLAYDASQADGTHFLVMEYVDGVDLARLVRQRGALPVAEACEYARQAALGLQHAHEKGLVHRDVKPSNILLTRDGDRAAVKLLDLGLARVLRDAGEQTAGELTGDGAVMGTPDYMAPEQAREAHAVDIRADIYSLGCTLYFLLGGRVPFPGGTVVQKVVRHQQANPAPLEQLRPDVPAALGAAVRKMMAKRPEDRYQTPAEVAAALVPFCPPGSVPAAPAGSGSGQIPVVTVPVVVVRPATVSPNADTVAGGGTVPGGAPSETLPLLPPRASRAWPARAAAWVRRSPRRAAAVGGAVALLVLLMLLFRGGSGGGKEDPDGGGAARWPLENLTEIPRAEGQVDWLPEGLVLVLGSHRGRHWGPVRAVAFSPDGKLVASGGDDAMICVWKADTLEEYRVLKGHKGPVRALAFTRDGRLLSGGEDKTVRLWDVGRKKQLWQAEGHTNPVVCLAVSDDGKRALSGDGGRVEVGGGVDFTVRLWDLAEGRQLHCLKGHTGAVSSVAFAANGRRALSVGSDRTIRRWDLDGGSQLPAGEPFPKGTTWTSPPVLSEDAGWVSWQDGATVRWRKSEGAEPPRSASPSGGNGAVLAISAAGGRVAAAVGFELWAYGLSAGELQRPFTASGHVLCLAFSADGRRLVSGNRGGLVQIWDIEAGKEVAPRPGHTGPVSAVAIAPDGRRILTGGYDYLARLWDLTSDPPGQEVKRIRGHTAGVNCVLFGKEPQRAISASYDGTVRFWDLGNDREQHHVPVRALGLSSDGRFVGIQPKDNTAGVRDVETGKEDHVSVRYGTVYGLAFAPDGRHVAVAGDQPTLYLWDRQDPAGPREYPAPVVGSGGGAALAFSPHGQLLLTGHLDGAVRIWEAEKSKQGSRRAFAGIVTPITSVAWAPDEKAVAASSNNGQVVVWDREGGTVRQEWRLAGMVHAVAFAPDGRHLLTANANGTVFVLRLKPSP